MRTKPTTQLTLKDRLSRLTHRQAVELLNPQGEKLLNQGGCYEIDIDRQAVLDEQRFHLTLPYAEVCIKHNKGGRRTIGWQCSCRKQRCEHIGAALSLVLEEKTPLG